MSRASSSGVGRSLLAVLALLPWLAPEAVGGQSAGPNEPPNVVLITLDTLRSDHLGCYGYERPTSPAIDKLAQRSDRWTHAWSTSPWTIPSHASMFTGRYTFQHGAHSWRDPEGAVQDCAPLGEQHVTLAEALSSAGYETAAFIANRVHLGRRFGFDQGFESFFPVRKPGVEISKDISAWLEARTALAGAERPFFLFVNLMDTHRPYNTTPLPPERAKGLPAALEERSDKLLNRLLSEVMVKGESAPADLVQKVIDQYDLSVANADLAVEHLIADLEARGLFENTLFILTSDHGEYFGEHGLVEHSKDIYEEAVRIPLLVKHPGQAQGRLRTSKVSLADVPGIVFSALPPALAQHGASFPRLPTTDRVVLTEIHYTRLKDLLRPWGKRFDRIRVALYAGKYKYIQSSDGAHELYDLELDPGEETNLAQTRPDLVKVLDSQLASRWTFDSTGRVRTERVTLSEEELAELRELGYL